ncbi:MICOS complex subunit mic25a-like isoform X2 [Mugil cephalus]|uniref:MICOS complex subunit mic25a-like isoform X2 n=1 Tax=Mugil cephalus TaxID=48193 RepID=UPI001FB5FD38|nr:MICOS complex subunit mic25a-like isoform X2 [Mugil cephalus]
MGGNGSTARKVSFGLDEDEKVTVIEGVKLSEDVLRRMRESQGTGSNKPTLRPPDSHKPTTSPKPAGSSSKEIQEEMRKNFELQQSMVQEQLARLAQREREVVTAAGLDEMTPAVIIEKGKAHEAQDKAMRLAKRLEAKEKELATLSNFYKEQLEIMEKKNLDIYNQTAEQYHKAATKAEAHVRPRHTGPLCTELQDKVFQCYRENPKQTLQCSSLAKQYIACVHQAKKAPLTNHG